eukprot:scaffold2986_cov30-Tisochrysis_lutea.AAC.2
MHEQTSDRVRSIVDELRSDPLKQIVLFANTAGVGGMVAGRDLWVMAWLNEVGIPLSRMARLGGGFNGWRDDGHEVTIPQRLDSLDTYVSLDSLLSAVGLSHLIQSLNAAGETWQSCAALAAEPRVAVLNHFKLLGIPIADRQKLAGVLARARREGAFDR